MSISETIEIEGHGQSHHLKPITGANWTAECLTGRVGIYEGSEFVQRSRKELRGCRPSRVFMALVISNNIIDLDLNLSTYK